MSFNVEGKYYNWELIDDNISNVKMAINWARTIQDQDKIKVRVVNNINNKVEWCE